MSNFIDVTSQSAIIGSAYDQMSVKPLRPAYIFDAVAQEKNWNLNRVPTKGDTMIFTVLDAFSSNTAALSATNLNYNGGTNTSYTRRSVSLAPYGNYSGVDVFELEPEQFVDSMLDVGFSLQDQAMNSLNEIAKSEIDKNKYSNEVSGTLSATYHYYASNGTAGSMGQLRAVDVRKVVADMKADNVVPYEDGNYIGIVHPNVSTQLRSETGNAAWSDAVLAGDQAVQRRFNGEIGIFEGVRFVVNNQVSGAGTSTYSNYFMGREGVGKAVGKDVGVSMNPVLQGPHSSVAIVRWNALVGYKIIRREAIRIVSSIGTQR
jgi:N4-gp56 family major capsid protein